VGNGADGPEVEVALVLPLSGAGRTSLAGAGRTSLAGAGRSSCCSSGTTCGVPVDVPLVRSNGVPVNVRHGGTVTGGSGAGGNGAAGIKGNVSLVVGNVSLYHVM
jgi:hypothetical protein